MEKVNLTITSKNADQIETWSVEICNITISFVGYVCMNVNGFLHRMLSLKKSYKTVLHKFIFKKFQRSLNATNLNIKGNSGKCAGTSKHKESRQLHWIRGNVGVHQETLGWIPYFQTLFWGTGGGGMKFSYGGLVNTEQIWKIKSMYCKCGVPRYVSQYDANLWLKIPYSLFKIKFGHCS